MSLVRDLSRSLLLGVGVITRASISLGGWGLGTLSMLGLTACSTVLPQTMLNLEVDILMEPLGVMDRMNRLWREKDIVLFSCSGSPPRPACYLELNLTQTEVRLT